MATFCAQPAVGSQTQVLPLDPDSATSTPQIWVTALEALQPMVLTYASWNDPLSRQLITWIRETYQKAHDFPDTTVEEVDRLVRTTINRLSEILQNSLDQTLLQDPQIDHTGACWEKRHLEMYLERNKCSPQDGKRLVTQPHAFAKAMLSWLHSSPHPPQQAAMMPYEEQQKRLAITDFAMGVLANNAKLTSALREVRSTVEQTTIACKRTVQATKEECAQQLLAEQQKVAAHVTTMNSALQSLTTNYQNVITRQGRELQEIKPKVEQLEAAQARSEQEIKELKGEAESMRETIDSLRWRCQQLENELKDDGGMCTIL